MAMTKKEKAAMDAAILRAETLAALRWTGPVLPDVMPPSGGGYSEGWDYDAYSKRVWFGWRGCVTHGDGPAPKDGKHPYVWSQQSRCMFSTRLLALRALRHEEEKRCADDLLKIDRQIASAETEEGTSDGSS